MKKNKKRKLNKLNIYLTINSVILAWLSIMTILILKKYDILPFKYMILSSLGLIIVPGLLILLMMKKKMKKVIKIISSFISILIITILTILLIYLQKTFKFLDNLIDDGYIVKNYSVIVLKDGNYNKIEELENKNINYFFNNTEEKDTVLNELNKKVTSNNNEAKDYDELIKNLYDKTTDAIIMEESYIGIIEENNDDFSKDTKVIYTIEIKIKAETTVKEVNVSKDTFNVYISGIDTYGNIAAVSRSDVNIIATVNPNTKQILLTTIPRDYYVQLDGTKGYKDKLTHAGIYGIDKSIKTIENLLDIDINYYAKVNFSSLEKIVNELGGVDVYSEYSFIGCEGTSFSKGYNKVNGHQALEFARTRKTIDGGDRARGKNQQALIQAILKKACSKEIITRYTGILNALEGSFQTSMPTEKMTDIIKKQINEMTTWNVTSINLDGSNGSEYTYSYPNQQLYVMIPFEETIQNAKDMIKKVYQDEILNGSYNDNSTVVNTPTTVAPQQEQPKTEEKKQEQTNTEKPKEKQETTNQQQNTAKDNEKTTQQNTEETNNTQEVTEQKEQVKEPDTKPTEETPKEETSTQETPKEEPSKQEEITNNTEQPETKTEKTEE